MRFSFLFICFFSFLCSFSQSDIKLKGEVNVDEFPIIDFNFNFRSPEKIQDSDLKLFEISGEDNKEVSNRSYELIKDTVDYSSQNKCVLILLEFLSHYDKGEQNKTFQKALNELFDEGIIKSGDKFKICTFAHKKNGSVLVSMNENFTDDVEEIKKDFKPKVLNNKQSSNIYGALREGVEMLSNLDNDLPKFVFLLSDEFHNDNDNEESNDDVINFAKKKEVVINTIKYNRSDYGQRNVPSVSIKTFGEKKVLSKSSGGSYVNNKKKNEIKSFIKKTLSNAIKRSKGVDYKVTATLNNKIKDGKKHKIELKINAISETVKYKAPGNFVVAQFQENLVLAIVFTCVIFLFILIIFLLIISSVKKKKRKREQLNRNLVQQQNRLKDEQQRIIKEQELFKNQEEQKRQLEKKRELEKKEKIAEEKLLKEMKNLGPLPILKYNHKGDTHEYVLNKPITKIGRQEGKNDILILNKNFSRIHFAIKFSKGAYKVLDNKSLNGTFLNGKKIKTSTLNKGDVIEVAKVKFYFL